MTNSPRIKPMLKKFEYGSHSETPFKYVGLQVKKGKDGITMDQDHYVQGLEVPSMECVAGVRMEDIIENHYTDP